jgi:hypothetical protein
MWVVLQRGDRTVQFPLNEQPVSRPCLEAMLELAGISLDEFVRVLAEEGRNE